jgi:hypothetical protein
MGMIDRVIRTLIALTIAVLFYLEVITGTLGIVLLILGGVFLLTSIIGFCPLYLPFGIKTCKSQK